VVSAEQLGGANVQFSTSGLAHFVTQAEREAIELAKIILAYLPSNHLENPPLAPATDDPRRADLALNTLVPEDPTLPYDMQTVIERVMDRGSFLEVQGMFARNATVGLARMGGQPVGVVAQVPGVLAGALDIDASDKISRWVRFCDAFNLPLITFVDTPGFLPGVDQEYQGIIRHGAKIVYAYATATVPKISVVTRKAYGGAYVVMSSKNLGTDVTFAWPSAEIAVMGGEGAANVLFRSEIAAAADPAAARAQYAEEYRKRFLTPYAGKPWCPWRAVTATCRPSPMDTSPLSQAIFITVTGMGLVFVLLGLLWGLMALIVRMTAERPAPASASPATIPPDREQETDRRRRAAAAAVAVALALQQPGDESVPQSMPISPWRATLRGNALSRRSASYSRRPAPPSGGNS
jgi:Na+-transporting methylmalonyl-CoA/oxaloacetate decarboxylase gamma subunit